MAGASNVPSVETAAEGGAMNDDKEDNLIGLSDEVIAFEVRDADGGTETRVDGSHLSCTGGLYLLRGCTGKDVPRCSATGGRSDEGRADEANVPWDGGIGQHWQW